VRTILDQNVVSTVKCRTIVAYIEVQTWALWYKK